MSGRSAGKRSDLTREELGGWIALLRRAQRGETSDERASRAKTLLDMHLASLDEQELLEFLVRAGETSGGGQ